jgi:hypothetical protein
MESDTAFLSHCEQPCTSMYRTIVDHAPGEDQMKVAKQWPICVIAVTALLIASASPLCSQTQTKSHESTSDIKNVQHSLQDRGFYDGQIDGRAGSRTRAGIRQYQQAENLPVTGQVDAQTATKLGIGGESVGSSFKGAGREVGQGSLEAGHEIMKGKPIAAGKEMGKGFGRGGKKVSQGVKEAVNPVSERGKREKEEQPEMQQ